MRKKSGRGSSVSVIKCRVKRLTFSVNALADDLPAQCGWGWRPLSEFVIVSEAGHDARDPGMNDAVVAATDRFAAPPSPCSR